MTPRAVTTLVLWQWLTVLLGVVLTGFFLRFCYSDWPDGTLYASTYPRLIAKYGFWLCLLPLVWATASVLSVGALDALPQLRKSYAVAGWAIWAALMMVLTISVSRAYADGIGYQVEEQNISREYQEQHPGQ